MKTKQTKFYSIAVLFLSMFLFSCETPNIGDIGPQNFRVGKIGYEAVLFSWDPVPDATSYTLYSSVEKKVTDSKGKTSTEQVVSKMESDIKTNYYLKSSRLSTSSASKFHVTANIANRGQSLTGTAVNPTDMNYYGDLWYNITKNRLEWTEYPVPYYGSSRYCLVESTYVSSSCTLSTSALNSNGAFCDNSYYTISNSGNINSSHYYAVYVLEKNLSTSYYQQMTAWVWGSDLIAKAKSEVQNTSTQGSNSQENTEPGEEENYDISSLVLYSYKTGSAPEFTVR